MIQDEVFERLRERFPGCELFENPDNENALMAQIPNPDFPDTPNIAVIVVDEEGELSAIEYSVKYLWEGRDTVYGGHIDYVNGQEKYQHAYDDFEMPAVAFVKKVKECVEPEQTREQTASKSQKVFSFMER